jgi:nitrite reductase/ring-hydroxylating ferredoxin subunit
MAWTKLAVIGDVPKDSVIEVEHEGNLYAVCNADGEFRALSGVCPHDGGPLGQGTVSQGLVVCPWHMWEFDPSSGACPLDETLNVPVYPTKVEGDSVLVDLP